MGDDTTKPEREPGFKNYKMTAAEKRGQARADMAGWRKKLQASKVKFDDTQKGIYLNTLRKTGRKNRAALAAGVSGETISKHRENDADFLEAELDALAVWADYIHKHAIKLSVEGVAEPIVGGKDKDEIVAYKQVFATNILAMEMRRVEPEYKERTEIDLNNKGGGVLLVPADVDVETLMRDENERNKDKKEPGTE